MIIKNIYILLVTILFLISSCTNYEPWIRQGISEDQANSWMDLEIKPDEAGLWHSIKVSPKDSIKWKDDEFGVGRVQPQNNAIDWVKKGFNRKSSTSWREKGFDPVNASNWKSNNFNLKESVSWKKKGFSPSEANAWNENDFSLKESVSWKKEGFNSSSAKEWTDENIALSDASIWSKESFTASESKVWIDKGFSPAKAKIYKDWLKEGFSLEEADKWMKIEENPSVAKAWKELEISFERVKQAKAQNISASEYKEYSGIGYDIGTMVLAKSNSISANEAKGWSKEGYDLENTIEAKKSGKNLEKVQEEHKNSRIVIATGTGVNEKEAIQEAGRNAVKKAVGFYMTSETALENDELIKDEILTYSGGFVTGFKVLSQEKDEDDLINIKASVKVAFRRLNTKLKNMNILGDFYGD